MRLFHVRRTRCKAGNSPPPIIRSCLAPAGFNPLVVSASHVAVPKPPAAQSAKAISAIRQTDRTATDDIIRPRRPCFPGFPGLLPEPFQAVRDPHPAITSRINRYLASDPMAHSPYCRGQIVGAISPVSSPFRLPRGPGVPNLRQTKTGPLSPLNGQATMSSARRVGKLRFLSHSRLYCTAALLTCPGASLR